MPTQATLAITPDNGDVVVRGVVGGHKLQSKNGDISYRLLAGASARLQVETDRGAIDDGVPTPAGGAD